MIDIKKIVFKDLDGKTQSTNFIKSINNKEVPESGDVVLDTIEKLSVQGSKMKISKSNGSSDILELPAGGVKTVEGIEPDENGNVVLSLDSSESHQSTDSINEISLDTHHRYHEITLNTSETTLKFIENQNSENNSTVLKLELFIKQGTGTNTVIWPENIKWENGTKPVLSLEKDNVDLISLISLDNGQNFYGFSKAVWLS